MISWAVSPWFDLLLLVAMTCRVTRLIVDDDLFAPVRAWADRQEAEHWKRREDYEAVTRMGLPPWKRSHRFGWFAGKVTGCSWCASPHVAAGAWAIWYLAPAGVFVGAGIVCAGSLVAGLLGDHA